MHRLFIAFVVCLTGLWGQTAGTATLVGNVTDSSGSVTAAGAGGAGGMPVPDSALARRARELIADVAAPFLVNHSVRCYAWAVELARHDQLQFDPEILYASAMFHDIGLVPAYDLGGDYAVDGAIAAKRRAV